ncbi:DCDA1-like protein [Mya arenaria]|uniref:DCDA1-like protein n=1 Tax=Mya arenaria TaxID=6604 RepID=A0ABY7FSA4_MYAAR|nr:DCDA1-like protein [Mya arenaria]
MENFFEYTNGELFCESVSVSSIKDFLQKQSFKTVSPVFVYSKNQIVSNVNAYKLAMKKLEINAVLNYAMKANMNPTVLKIMKDLGCSVTLVSGNELALALKVGFDLRTMILNGNGKQKWEIELAVKHGCLLNIDGMFNLEQTIEVCRRLGTKARVLLRVNPNIPLDDGVHQYNRTGVHGSKFGIERRELAAMAEVVCREPCAAEAMLADIRELRKHDFPNIRVINLGGGLGIDYTKRVISVIDSVFKDDDVSLILEPGRSLIGNAVILLTEVIGVKHGHHMNYIVVDGSMTEVVRPALYGAYHHIDLAQPSHVTNADTHTNDRSHVTTSDTQYITAQHRQMTKTDGQTENPFSFTSGKENPAELGKRTPADGRSDEVNQGWGSGRQTYEVVGPVCESGDFLGHAM